MGKLSTVQKELTKNINKAENFVKNLANIFEEIFGEDVDFCEICCAKGKCNGYCCYEQIKEKFEELK